MSDNMNEFFGEPGEVPIKAAGKLAEKIATAKDPVSGSVKSERSRKMKASRAKGKDLERRGMEYMRGKGYTVYRANMAATTPKGQFVSRDFAGIGDFMAFRSRVEEAELVTFRIVECALVNTTTEDEVKAHIRTFLSPTKVDLHTGLVQIEATKQWLELGNEILILGYSKGANGRYLEPTMTWVSLAMVREKEGK